MGRDQIPVKLDSKRVPLDPITYTEMRDSVPRKVCIIERGESTKTPLYQRGKVCVCVCVCVCVLCVVCMCVCVCVYVCVCVLCVCVSAA